MKKNEGRKSRDTVPLNNKNLYVKKNLLFLFRHDCQDGSDEDDCNFSHLTVNREFK
jgi:hypothetical protein